MSPQSHTKHNASFMEIDSSALKYNFQILKNKLDKNTKIACMVKAFAYGTGGKEIAEALLEAGADYLAVAFISEGVELRELGIEAPIFINNPHIKSLDTLLLHNLEPVISSFAHLEAYISLIQNPAYKSSKIHLKFDTGMARLGFGLDETPQLIQLLQAQPKLVVASMMSHLAAAADADKDAFTEAQAQLFIKISQQIRSALGIEIPRHLLNTAGIIRFSQYAFEMVRPGIGLYGCDPRQDILSPLKEVASLHTVISQIHTYPLGHSVSYGRAQFTKRVSRIATLSIGYGDGVFRSLGCGKVEFLVRGKRAPTFGQICMDMLMIDVTNIPEARAGDDVVLFGQQGDAFISVSEMAQAAGTISYEILTRISQRVFRKNI